MVAFYTALLNPPQEMMSSCFGTALNRNAAATFSPLTADATSLQQMLTSGSITSVDLVKVYLAQIQKHDDYLHAMIQTTPTDILEAAAKALDDERAAGKVRGPLHGIPIIIKASLRKTQAPSLSTSLLNAMPRIT